MERHEHHQSRFESGAASYAFLSAKASYKDPRESFFFCRQIFDQAWLIRWIRSAPCSANFAKTSCRLPPRHLQSQPVPHHLQSQILAGGGEWPTTTGRVTKPNSLASANSSKIFVACKSFTWVSFSNLERYSGSWWTISSFIGKHEHPLFLALIATSKVK